MMQGKSASTGHFRKHPGLHFALYFCFAVTALLILPFFGAEPVPFATIGKMVSGTSDFAGEILLRHRLPRVLLAFLCGAGLAACGAALQVMLENPLADPFVLGIAGCGAVGASLAIVVPGMLFYAGPFSSVQLFALTGSGIAVGISVFTATRFGGSAETVILAGVTLNMICGAVMLLLRYLVDPTQLMVMDRWLMGGLDVVGWDSVGAMVPVFLAGSLLLFPLGGALNLLALDSGLAAGHGVDVPKIRFLICLATGLLVGSTVAVAGPIGFVGLIIPQMVRRVSGPDLRWGLFSAALCGGTFLAVCDMLARTIAAPVEMPVGILTAVIGGPIFLKLLFGRSMGTF